MGDGWPELARAMGLSIPRQAVRGPLPYEETAAVYNSAAIVLGLQNSPLHLTQLTFDILGSGGFLLTLKTPAVERVFAPGRHLAVTASAWETPAIVDHYLTRPDKRQAIARAGQQLVHQKHTYRDRAVRLLALIGRAYPAIRVRPA